MKRYILHPGPVFSRNDRDLHQISAPRLAHLYGVDPRDCVIAGPGIHPQAGQIELYPDYSGRYELPETSR